MRIVLGIGNFSHGYGMPYVVNSIAKELVSKGNEVIVLAGKGNFTGVPVVNCGYNETFKHAYVGNAIKKILDMKPDIFHSHYYPMDLCGALVSSKTKHIMHVHGILSKEYRNNLKVSMDCLRGTFTESIGLRFSTQIIAISQFLKNDVVNRYSIDPNRVAVIYPGIDLNLYSPDKYSTRLLSSTENELTLISTGAIAERKGQHLLVEAMRWVVKEEPKARLLLIGRTGQEDPLYIKKLQDRIRSYKLDQNIIFKGFLPRNLMPELYTHSNVFITGTVWEGFGLPIAEAMASGVPVVAFDTASMHELIINGKTGFKVPPFNTRIFAEYVINLLQDARLRKKIGQNCRMFAEQNFEIQTNTNRVICAYNSLT